MSKQRDFAQQVLGSSPTKELDRLFEEQPLPDAGTGWTPYIDKIFGNTQMTPSGPCQPGHGPQGQPGSASAAAAAVMAANSVYRASPRGKRQQRNGGSSANCGAIGGDLSACSVGTIGSILSPNGSAKIFSSPQVDPALWAALQQPLPPPPPGPSQSQPQSQPMSSRQPSQSQSQLQQRQQSIDPLGSLNSTSLKTPIADKSFKMSDIFLETPSFLKGEGGVELFDKENDPLLLGLGKQLAPLSSRSGSVSAGVYKTPLKVSNTAPPQSSPSTILLTSTIKKADRAAVALAGVQQSPTPATKSHLKKPPCKLVRANSALEPAMGIFHDGEPQKRQQPRPQQQQQQQQQQRQQLNQLSQHPPHSQQQRGLPMMATFSQSFPSQRRHRPQQGDNGKFQIIFADMNSLKSSYGTKRAKKAAPRRKKSLPRFKTMPAVMPSKKSDQTDNN